MGEMKVALHIIRHDLETANFSFWAELLLGSQRRVRILSTRRVNGEVVRDAGGVTASLRLAHVRGIRYTLNYGSSFVSTEENFVTLFISNISIIIVYVYFFHVCFVVVVFFYSNQAGLKKRK